MNNLSMDFLAIDADVFCHLLIPKDNPTSHIDRLLSALGSDKVGLLVDDTNRIQMDYVNQVIPRMDKASDTDNKRYILQYWMNVAPRTTVQCDNGDAMLDLIRIVIHERGAHADRTFVAVAFRMGRPLVTDDKRHILEGIGSEWGRHGYRRDRLLAATKKNGCQRGAKLLHSIEAVDEL
jgi:hypothetical protein